MYPRNAASPEPIAIGPVILIADGTVQTSGVTVRIKPIGVAEGDGAGTTAYSTDGVILYTPTQAETNYTSFVLIAKKASCIPASITIITTASATPGTVLLAPVTHTSAVVPNVTLVDTTTTNTDMRGTDGANTATPLDAAGIRAALGLNTANIDTQLADLPTVAEFNARTLVAADYFVVSDYTAPLDASGTRAALGLATANLDTQLADLPTVAEFEARSLPSADYLVVGDLPANFAALGINASGHVSRVTLVDTTTDLTNGGGGGTDWTSDEKEEIRYRLGIDGTATAPSTATGAKLGDVEMTQWEIDASATAGKVPMVVVSDNAVTSLSITDKTYTAHSVMISLSTGITRLNTILGDLTGKIIGFSSATITGTGVQAQLPTGAISATTIADETLTASKFSTALSALWTNLIAMITGSGASAAFTEKAVENVATAGLTPEQIATISESVATEVVEQIGTSSVNVLPAVGIAADRSPGVSLTPVVGETILQSITLYATDGTTPISLAGKTLAIPFETMSGIDIAVIPDADITVSGTDSNVVTFAYPSAVTASERTLRFAIKDAAAPLTEYLKGICVVTSGPRVDA